MVAPAEDTLVGTGQGGRGLHAPVGLDAIEAVLVAAPPPPQHGLGPAAQLHSAVGACITQHLYLKFVQSTGIGNQRLRIPRETEHRTTPRLVIRVYIYLYDILQGSVVHGWGHHW